jgi:hypothetical protein
MNFCGLKSNARLFLLFWIAILMWHGITLNLNLQVMGESNSTEYRAIDLYTQKEPYNGKGPNQPSDAFAPQEEVILYAYVTYRDDPVPGKIVAFEVHGPLNGVFLTQTATTNAEGIATVSFRITWPNGYSKDEIFGMWTVVAVVDIAEVAVKDTLSFMVGWIIELIKVETVNVNNIPKFTFGKNEQMCFRLTVKNIAMTEKIATLILDVYDNLSIPFGQITLKDKTIMPGITTLFIEDLIVPEWVSLGLGVVYANAYTMLPSLGGVPWCPQVSATFSIVKYMHDVAVISVVPSTNEAFPCQRINVSVVVRNNGDATESFNVNAYYDSALIGTLAVLNLPPKTDKNLTFIWCTCCVSPGNYTLSAVADTVPGEVNIENNRFVDGIVQIKPLPTPPPPTPAECIIPRWLLAFLFLIAVLIVITLTLLAIFILLWLKEKRKERRDEKPLVIAPAKSVEIHPSKTSKKCNVCGNEFPAVYTFCPHCMSFHGKD